MQVFSKGADVKEATTAHNDLWSDISLAENLAILLSKESRAFKYWHRVYDSTFFRQTFYDFLP